MPEEPDGPLSERGLVPPLKVLRKRLNGVYRADGFSGPTRRYVLIVVLLVGLASLPTLAAIIAGTNQLDSGTTGAMDVPFLPPPSSGPVTPYAEPTPAPSLGPESSRRRAEGRQTKTRILYGHQEVPHSTAPRTNRGPRKKSTVASSDGAAAVHKPAGSWSNAGSGVSGSGVSGSGFPGSGVSGSGVSGPGSSGDSGTGHASSSPIDESSSSSDGESSSADESDASSESAGDDEHHRGGWHRRHPRHRGPAASDADDSEVDAFVISDVDRDRPRWSRPHHCEESVHRHAGHAQPPLHS